MADVDTFAEGSNIVHYSHGIEYIDGHLAFGANWVRVGYYNAQDDKLNSFQLVIISRSDTGVGNFDIEFNYDQISWETGNSVGYGDAPARCGLSNNQSQTIELAGSGQTLVQLDRDPNTGIPNFLTGLIYRSRNSAVPGRFIFQVRSGEVLGALNVFAGTDKLLDPSATSAPLVGTASDPSGGAVSVQWTVVQGPPGVTFSDATILNPTLIFPADEYGIVLQLTATSVADPTITAADTIIIRP